MQIAENPLVPRVRRIGAQHINQIPLRASATALPGRLLTSSHVIGNALETGQGDGTNHDPVFFSQVSNNASSS